MTFYASNIFPCDGVQTEFDFAFAGVNPADTSGAKPYLYAEDVRAQELFFDAEGQAQVADRTVTIDPSLPTRAVISGLPIAAGRQVRIYRKTEIRFPLVDYRDRQTVSELDLDLSARQNVFLAQEAIDAVTPMALDVFGNFDALDKRIVNLADGINDQDAVNIRQVMAWRTTSELNWRFLETTSGPEEPTVRDNGEPLEIGDRWMNDIDNFEYIYTSGGWLPNNVDGANLAGPSGSTLVGRGTGTVEESLDDIEAAATALAATVAANGSATDLEARLTNTAFGAGIVAYDPAVPYPLNTVGSALRDIGEQAPSVAKFGIVPDGVTDWESSVLADWEGLKAAARTTGVRWPAGKSYEEYYACGINFDKSWDGAKLHFEPGSVMGGVFHLISGPTAASQFQLSSATRTSNVVTLQTTAPHNFTTGDRIKVRNVYQPHGAGIVNLNTDDVVCTVTGANSLTFPSVGPNVTGQVSGVPFGPAYVSNSPLMNVRITGLLTTTDRLGTINCKDCYIEACWVLNDPARHSSVPGTGCRGAHLYVGTDGLVIGDLLVDYATGPNTDAAFALDGNSWNPSNCTFGRVFIRDSGFHGAYITGYGHHFGELRIDGFAKEPPSGTVLQDSNGLAQSSELKGLWINRCWATRIDALFTDQRAQDGTRGFEDVQALIDQTGHPSYGTTTNSGVSIGKWFATNVRKNGIRFGETPTYDSVTCVVEVDALTIRNAPEHVFAGQYMANFYGGSAFSSLRVGTLSLIGTGLNLGIRTHSTADVIIGKIIAIDHANQILRAEGRTVVGTIYGRTTSSFAITTPVVDLRSTAQGSRIDSIDVSSTQAKTGAGAFWATGVIHWSVGSIRSRGYVPTSGCVRIDSASAAWAIDKLDLLGTGSTGVGMAFAGVIAGGKLGGGRIQSFATGMLKGTASFTAGSNAAIATQSVGNTTNTDLASTSFSQLACVGVTL